MQVIYGTPLHVAAQKGNLEIVNLLIQLNGISINIQNEI